eukprot:scaffold4486_cov125-Isochrysis_galbana.AAC.2
MFNYSGTLIGATGKIPVEWSGAAASDGPNGSGQCAHDMASSPRKSPETMIGAAESAAAASCRRHASTMDIMQLPFWLQDTAAMCGGPAVPRHDSVASAASAP